MKLRIRERVLLVVTLPICLFGCLLALGLLATEQARRVQVTGRAASDTRLALASLGAAVLAAESGARGAALSRSPAALEQYRRGALDVRARVVQLAELLPPGRAVTVSHTMRARCSRHCTPSSSRIGRGSPDRATASTARRKSSAAGCSSAGSRR